MSRRIRSDCVRAAPCGKTSLTRCRKHSAGLEDCLECKLVNRVIIGEWSIVNRKGSVVYVVNGCRCTAFILERSSETDEDTKDIAVDVRFARLIPSIGVRKR